MVGWAKEGGLLTDQTDLFVIAEKVFCETSFQVGIDLQKVQKQCRDENMQEDNPTIEW